MNHIATGMHESKAAETTAFERWCGRVEREYGITSLDGDEATDGYSLDYALEAYQRGATVEQYVATLPA